MKSKPKALKKQQQKNPPQTVPHRKPMPAFWYEIVWLRYQQLNVPVNVDFYKVFCMFCLYSHGKLTLQGVQNY